MPRKKRNKLETCLCFFFGCKIFKIWTLCNAYITMVADHVSGTETPFRV